MRAKTIVYGIVAVLVASIALMHFTVGLGALDGLMSWHRKTLYADLNPEPAPRTAPLMDAAILRVGYQAYPDLPSAWLQRETGRFQALLAKQKAEVLVLPFQVQNQGLSRAQRSLMAAILADALRGSGQNVADTYAVARALGDGARHYDDAGAQQLAKAMGARRVIFGYVGHDGARQMQLTFRVGEFHGEQLQFAQAPLNWPELAFSPEQPPVDVFVQRLPEFLQALGVKATTSPGERTESSGLALTDPLTLLGSSGNALDQATRLLALAAITPPLMERVRERFAEKAYLALLQAAPTAPEWRLLAARTQAELGLRRAALNRLGDPGTAAERHLRAYLEGDLPAMQAEAAGIPADLLGLPARMEVATISAAYLLDSKGIVASAKLDEISDPVWHWLAVRTVEAHDSWSQHRNVDLKRLLDRDLPLAGKSLDDLLRAGSALGDPELSDDSWLWPMQHIDNALAAGAIECCPGALAGAGDYYDLINALAADNAIRRVRFLATIQGERESAQHLLKVLQPWLQGLPSYALAFAESQLAGQYDDPNALQAAQQAANDSIKELDLLAQGASRAYAEADGVFARLMQSRVFPNDHYFTGDHPYREFYPIHPTQAIGSIDAFGLPSVAGSIATSNRFADALDNIQYRYQQVQELGRWVDRLPVLERLQPAIADAERNRFHGNPATALVAAMNLWGQGDGAAAAQLLERALAADPTSWDTRKRLIDVLFWSGEQERAFAVGQAFPGFAQGSSEHPVAIANVGHDLATQFLWAGYVHEAQVFSEYAAAQETGAESELGSRTRLAQFRGDFAAAQEAAMVRVQSYGSAWSIRELLGLMFARGDAQNGWALFAQIATRPNANDVWESALVGLRREHKSIAETAAWARQLAAAGADDARQNAATAVFRAGVVDRVPEPELAPLIAELELPVAISDGAFRRGEQTWSYAGTSLVDHPQATLDSDLVAAARGLSLLRQGQYEQAEAALRATSEVLIQADYETNYLAPYYILAALRSGQEQRVPELFQRAAPTHFEMLLAEAVRGGVAGELDASLKSLHLARVRKPLTGTRAMPTEYLYADVCMLLWQETKDNRYRAEALDWARANRVAQPWAAWPHALVALLSADEAERSQAAATAATLDADSAWLRQIDATQLQVYVRKHQGRLPLLAARSSPRI